MLKKDKEMPRPGKFNVTPYARSEFTRVLDNQVAKGLEEYGTPLQTHNGLDAVEYAMEEAVDLFQYLTQVKMERDILLEEVKALREKVRLLSES